MLIDVRADDPRPAYRQIVDEVHRAIATGMLKTGESLPAATQLARELKLNPNTVRQAYRTLAAEGTVRVKRGVGTFVDAPRMDRHRSALVARQIADRALREAFRHGLLASDLRRALDEIAPG